MDIKQILTFKTAAENLNFTQTATQLNFAQSSVTAQIKALESELGTPLFERLGKRLVLTEEGRKFKVYADQLIMISEEAKTAIYGEDEPTGTLTIGAQESQCTYRLPLLLKSFQEQFPKVKLVFKQAHSNEHAREQLLEGKLDLAFIMDKAKPTQGLIVDTLVQEELKIVVSPDYSIPTQQKGFPYDFEQATFLLTDEGCSYRCILEDTVREANLKMIQKFEFISIEAIKQCVLSGLGVAVLPAMAIEKELKAGVVKEIPWADSVSPIFTQIAWHKDKWMTLPLQAFIQLTRETFQEIQ
ncbi:LysR family transcriptional regulator [Evansella halocellulosilytica]|uniref:LysR family transcriptional regulator n=1 Tax=Evansella halocellulosilytica TaxID=2011013 RepID=UPI000BB9BD55|nr:LysR family transcriptional regulator [Evansella halocellulosilytica]